MRGQRRLPIILMASVLLTVAGCATNALRIEAAADVAQRGKAVAAVSRGFLADVERARYAVNVDIIAADPACRQPGATFRRTPALSTVTDPRNPPRGWLCEPLPAGADISRGLMLGPISDELVPTLLLIQSLASYSSAITKILEADAPNPVQDLENALDTARAAQGLLNALGAASRIVPAADDPRLAAVSGFIAFVSELANEAATVERLRELQARTGGGTAVVASLIDHMANWEQSRRISEQFGIDLSNSLLTAAVQENSPLAAQHRRTFAEDYYKRIQARTASAQLHDALSIALDGLRQAETDYQELLREHPRLTPEQRAHRAEIIRQRLTRAFELATSLITSFRGA